MDAPGARASEDAVNSTSEHDASTARSPSPSDTTQDDHEQRQQSGESSDGESEDSGQIAEEDEDEDEEDEDEEPRLKYAYLTKHLGSVYRNGDATSTFLVAGDKMVCLETCLLTRSPSS